MLKLRQYWRSVARYRTKKAAWHSVRAAHAARYPVFDLVKAARYKSLSGRAFDRWTFVVRVRK